MKLSKSLLCLGLWVFAATFTSQAQSKLEWFFRGVAYQTNAAGKTVTVPLTEKTLMKEIADAANFTDYPSWQWVYHIRGSEFGDTVSIVTRENGQTLDTIFGFYFGEAFGRVAITNAEHTIERRLDYIYTKQNSHSLGSAFITKRYVTDRRGNRRVLFEGQMQWVVQPNAQFPGGRVCVGRFTTGKTLF